MYFTLVLFLCLPHSLPLFHLLPRTAPHRTAPHRTAPLRTAPHRAASAVRISSPTPGVAGPAALQRYDTVQ